MGVAAWIWHYIPCLWAVYRSDGCAKVKVFDLGTVENGLIWRLFNFLRHVEDHFVGLHISMFALPDFFEL